MSIIQYQENERYRIEMRQKCREYSDLTEHITKKMGADLKDMQDYIWNNIFEKNAIQYRFL